MNIFADMAVIRLTKEFSFEAAHALDGYDGPCREIHGHSYRLFVTVKGCPADDDTNPKCGMVMDFGVLKSIVNEEVVSRFDHALVLRATRRDAPLRAVLAEWSLPPADLYAIYPPRLNLSARLRAFLDFLAARFNP